jgi:gentisate 1,2-dioxygenase
MPVGTYKKAHRHGPDFHVFSVTGHGYSLLWYEGDREKRRVEWHHGVVWSPPDQMFHQHFNTSREPARNLVVCFGSMRYPVLEERRRLYSKENDLSVTKGGTQIEYEDEDPRIRELYESELAKEGVELRMREVLTAAGRRT